MSVKRASSSWPARRPLSWKYASLSASAGELLQLLVGGAGFLGVDETGGVGGGSATVRCRMRSWSVVPIGAV